jgi:hypothetical protein
MTQNLEKKAPFKIITNHLDDNLEGQITFKLLPYAEH